MSPQTGFIGLGLMGQPMCQRLLRAGVPLHIWNRSPGKTAALQAAGANVAPSVAALVASCDVIMLCVSDTAALESVVFGEGGIASHGRAGQLLVDFSSIAPDATRSFAQRLAAHCGMRWVDAPVSGGVKGAESGQLVIMAGGAASDIDTLRPLLAHLSQRLTRMGDTGAGQVAKVCNQLIVASTAALIAETVQLAEAAGVDASLLAPALAGGFADSLPFQILAPRMAGREFAPVQWKAATLLKDLNNATALGNATQRPLPMASQAQALLHAHCQAGHGQHDLSSLILHYLSQE